MAKYSHNTKNKLTKDSRAEYPIVSSEVNGVYPTLIVKPAIAQSPSNFGYRNASLKDFNAKRGKKPTDTTGEDIDKGMARQIELFSMHVVEGWRDLLDEDGNPVEFSQAECKEFLESLDESIFEDLQQFCGTANNFWGSDVKPLSKSKVETPEPEEAEETAKNSQKDTSSTSDTKNSPKETKSE